MSVLSLFGSNGHFEREIEQREEQAEDLSPLNIESVDDVIKNGIDAMTVLNCLGELLRRYMNTPLSVLLLITAVIILTASENHILIRSIYGYKGRS